MVVGEYSWAITQAAVRSAAADRIPLCWSTDFNCTPSYVVYTY
jgi:hypothetical protein